MYLIFNEFCSVKLKLYACKIKMVVIIALIFLKMCKFKLAVVKIILIDIYIFTRCKISTFLF